MKSLTIDYPESVLSTLDLTPEAFEREARIPLAMKLFELGRLTSGQAAEVARDVYGLSVVGTAGLLLDAKRNGVVGEVGPILSAMRDNGYWIHDDIVPCTVAEAGEGSHHG